MGTPFENALEDAERDFDALPEAEQREITREHYDLDDDSEVTEHQIAQARIEWTYTQAQCEVEEMAAEGGRHNYCNCPDCIEGVMHRA